MNKSISELVTMENLSKKDRFCSWNSPIKLGELQVRCCRHTHHMVRAQLHHGEILVWLERCLPHYPEIFKYPATEEGLSLAREKALEILGEKK